MSDANPCIVIVEDDDDILSLVRDALEMEGFDSIGFSRPFPVTTLTVAPDLFVFDMMLPEVTGIELARRVQAEGHADTPIIAMSASRAMMENARRSGLFKAFISKPFD